MTSARGLLILHHGAVAVETFLERLHDELHVEVVSQTSDSRDALVAAALLYVHVHFVAGVASRRLASVGKCVCASIAGMVAERRRMSE